MQAYCLQNSVPHSTAPQQSSIDLRMAWTIAQSARQYKPDLLHAHDSHGHTACLLARLLFGCQVPLVLHRRVDFPIGQNVFSRLKYNHRQIAKIICVSQAIRQVIEPVIDDKDKLEVVHSGVDLQRFANPAPHRLHDEYNLPQGSKLVGNVAALTGHKDYFTFLQTARLVIEEDPHTYFLIMGDGGLYNELLAFRNNLNLQNHVIFTGFRHDIAQVLPELDVLLFPSEMEGLGTTVLDSYAAGVPVVATRAGGIPEMVDENQTALLADVKDAATLAHAVKRVLHEPGLGNKLVTNAYNLLQQRFTKEQMASNIIAVYNKILS